MPCKNQPLICI